MNGISGNCLKSKSIFVDTRDDLQQSRFLMFGVQAYFPVNYSSTNWFFEKAYYDVRHGTLSCCSSAPVGFHYIKNIREMYLLEYLSYQVHAFGISKSSSQTLPRKLTLHEILKDSDLESNSTLFKKHKVVHDMESSEIY